MEKDKTAQEILVQMYGKKDYYTYYETFDAMLSFGCEVIVRLNKRIDQVTAEPDESIHG